MYYRAKGKDDINFEEPEPIFGSKCTLKQMKSLFKYCNDTPLLWLVLILWKIRDELKGSAVSSQC